MRCHYEVLGVSRDATDGDIKKAYRVLALKWHPDKNTDRAEECTEVFQVIQQAYDVLSDRQERAWYDKHREQILKGGDNYVDDGLNLMHYFQTSAYRGYGDDENGFYSVYSFVFKTVAEEDSKFVDDKSLVDEIPTFGTSTSPFEDVKPFYDYWQSYCTFKTFVWLEKYDTRQASNRRVLRAMEKENKKLRDAGKKERNEEIRELVQYVRKRDRRLKAHREKREEEERQKTLLVKQKRAAQKKERLEKMKDYKEQDWNSMSHLEKNLNDIASHVDEEFGDDNATDQSGDEDFEDFYCIACEKLFKSDKALKNHEKSRKHREKVELIRQIMEEEEVVGEKKMGDCSYGDSESEVTTKVKIEVSLENINTEENCTIDVSALNLRDSLDLPAYVSGRSRSNSRRHCKSVGDKQDDSDEPGGPLHLADSVTLAFAQKVKNKKRHHKKDKNTGRSSEEEIDDDEFDEDERKMVELILRDDVEEQDFQSGDEVERLVVDIGDDDIGKKSIDVQLELKSDSKIFEPKQKTKSRRKSKKGQNDVAGDERKAESLHCNVCKTGFPSRNQLFKHINDSGHALRMANKDVVNEESRRSKGKKKK